MRAAKTKKPDKVIKLLAATLKEKLGERIKEVILFGSRARGDYEPESDYDVMVLVERKDKELAEAIESITWQINWDYEASITVFIYEQNIFQQEKYEPLFINVKREGLLVA